VTSPHTRTREARLWTLLLASSALYFFTTNDADPDLWGHLLFGREILANAAVPRVDGHAYTTMGQPWIDHEWLSQVVLAAIYGWSGSAGLLLLKLGIGALTLVLVVGSVRTRTQDAGIWGLVGLFTTAILARGFAFRPQIFTYLGAAMVLALLDYWQRGHRSVAWFLPLVFVLWVNLHGGVMLGLGMVAIFAAGQTLTDVAAARRAWGVWLACGAATAVNPYGPELLGYIWTELSRPHPITEWQAAVLTDPGQFAFFLMLALFVATLPFARQLRSQGWQVALAACAAVLALRYQRHTPVFAICAAAPLAAQLEEGRTWLLQRRSIVLGPVSRWLITAALVSVIVVQTTLVVTRLRRDGLHIVYAPEDYPVTAVRAMQQIGSRANLAVPLEWGEYVLWFLAPHVKVSLDGRFATVFPEQIVDDNFDFFAAAPGWRRLIDGYATDAALVPRDSACPIGTLSEWQLLYEDTTARLYARVGGPAWSGLQQLRRDAHTPPVAGTFP